MRSRGIRCAKLLMTSLDSKMFGDGFQVKEEIDDEQRCLDAASEAQGAGCVCVVPLGDPNETSAATGTATYSIVYSYAMLFLASILAVGVAI